MLLVYENSYIILFRGPLSRQAATPFSGWRSWLCRFVSERRASGRCADRPGSACTSAPYAGSCGGVHQRLL